MTLLSASAVVLVTFTAPLSVFAAELKVLDPNGLTRLTLDSSGMANVVVEFIPSGKAIENVVLVNVDSIMGDIDGQRRGPDKFIFPQVGDGTWRINVVPAREVARVSTDK